jgi:DNA-binding GntR family transcriptional regulator
MTQQPGSLLRLEKTGLRQQALAALRRAITSGELPPGTHLVETELSEALSISRGTLREAMRQLQQEGLISEGERGRMLVRQLDTKEIRDIFAVRCALESLAARDLCARPDRDTYTATLRAAVEEMVRREGDGLDARIESDLDFHRTLVRLSGNDTLLHSWTSLEGSIRMSIMWAGLDRAVANMNARRHLDIVDAIDTGDPTHVTTTVDEHMAVAADNLVTTGAA